MTILKSLAAASFLLLLVPAGQAFASTPHDLGSFQSQCMAKGGTFGLGGDADTYECDDLDGMLQVCDFGGKRPSCVSLTGPTPHRQTADNGDGNFSVKFTGSPDVEWTHRTYPGSPVCGPGELC